MSELRDTRLINKEIFDDPQYYCPAGGDNEFDILCEWSRNELVEELQKYDQLLFDKESAYDKAIEALNFLYHGDCGDQLGAMHFESVRLALKELGELDD